MNFTFHPLELPGVVMIEAVAYEDDRGLFMERYKQSTFAEHGITDVFCQDNLSKSASGVLRGLHYQLPPFDQAKLVGVVAGSIFDVAVDVRRGSETFGQWVGHELSAENRRMLYVPTGYAHGFLVTSETAVVTYKTSHEYARHHERGIRWDDPEIGIDWPLGGVGAGLAGAPAPKAASESAGAHTLPRLSDKDRDLPGLSAAELPALKRGNA